MDSEGLVGLVLECGEQRLFFNDVFLGDDFVVDQAGAISRRATTVGLSFSQATFGSLPPVAS
jgi:hypothetical protein